MIDRDSPVVEADLHAYVDGELPHDRATAVEAWLAAHPDDAARVAAWQAQAELIRARYAGVVQEPIPRRLDLNRLSRVDRRWSRTAAAAVIAAFVIGGVSGWFGRETWVGGLGGMRMFTSVASDAMEAYKLYVVEVRHPVEVTGVEESHLMQWLSKRLGYQLRAPDLQAMGLRFVGGRLLPGAAGAAAAFLMYEAASGERFTFYCARSAAAETALRYHAAGSVASFYWVDNNRGYVVSGPADRDRLLQVAQSIYGQIESAEKERG